MRRAIVVGNWKMNTLLAEARALVAAIRQGLTADIGVDVGVAPPAVLLMPMSKALDGSAIALGAQNLYHQPAGAFTGEISAPMLLDAGCRFVIVGHSERRQWFAETGEMLQRKVQAALAAGLDVIYCIGETLKQRQDGLTQRVLDRQLSEVLTQKSDSSKLTIAYEPVWAIGTGQNATPDQAQEAHGFIRGWLVRCFGAEAASCIRIQYGGSVKPSNAAGLLGLADVDGALVGGASLAAADFLAIIRAASAVRRSA